MGIVKWFKRMSIEEDLNTLRRKLSKGLITADTFCKESQKLYNKLNSLK